MHTLAIYWMPILLSAVAVWVASAMAWMMLPHHKGDHTKLPDEDAFAAFVKSAAIPPGNYSFPFCADHSKMKDAAMQKRWREGPNGMLNVWGQISMGRNMVLTFLVNVVVSYVIAYLLGTSGIRPGSGFMEVFKVAGTAGILAYCFAGIPNQIWFGAYPRTIAACFVDGVAYGLITGAIFAAMWPKH